MPKATKTAKTAVVAPAPETEEPQRDNSVLMSRPEILVADSLLDPALALAADIVGDLEGTRVANANRLRQLQAPDKSDEEGPDGEMGEQGFGLDPSHPDVVVLRELVNGLVDLEQSAVTNLERKMRAHPLGPWIKSQRGLGYKQAARLLATIGDPFINSSVNRPRAVSSLWAYCGLHVLPPSEPSATAQSDHEGGDSFTNITVDVLPDSGPAPWGSPRRATKATSTKTKAPGGDDPEVASAPQGPVTGVAARLRRGQRANWSTVAKMRTYLISESCVKQLCADCKNTRTEDNSAVTHVATCTCSKFRVVYDNRRAHTLKSRPDWTDGHRHNDALRIVSKAILKALWVQARQWHIEQGHIKSDMLDQKHPDDVK